MSPQEKLLCLLGVILAAMIAIIMHEIAHGYVAYKQGDPTAKMSGRLTLNPMAHFDLFGFVMMFTVGIGWAKPVPVNPNNYKSYRKGSFLVAIAGVTVNFLIALIAFTLYVVFFGAIQSAIIGGSTVAIFIYYFLEFSITLNVGLMAFNLIPIFPLDGFRMLESFTKYYNKYCTFMRRYGMQIFLGLFLLGFVADFTGIWWLDVLGNLVSAMQSAILDLITGFLRLVGVL